MWSSTSASNDTDHSSDQLCAHKTLTCSEGQGPLGAPSESDSAPVMESASIQPENDTEYEMFRLRERLARIIELVSPHKDDITAVKQAPVHGTV